MPPLPSFRKWVSELVATERVNLMTPDEMLDHALGQLDGHALETAELALAADAILAAKSARLRLVLDFLLDDGLDDIKAPANLAHMTALAVRELSRTKPVGKRTKRFSDYLPVTVGFRWADVAVAATILVAGVATLIPAIQRSRDRMNQAGCTFNLQNLGVGLLQYRDQNGSYPYIPRESPGSHAGSYALLLHDAGYLDDPARLHCPCFSYSENLQHPPLPNFEAACRLKAENPERFQRVIGG